MFIDASFLVWYNYKYRESVVSVRFLRDESIEEQFPGRRSLWYPQKAGREVHGEDSKMKQKLWKRLTSGLLSGMLAMTRF